MGWHWTAATMVGAGHTLGSGGSHGHGRGNLVAGQAEGGVQVPTGTPGAQWEGVRGHKRLRTLPGGGSAEVPHGQGWLRASWFLEVV